MSQSPSKTIREVSVRAVLEDLSDLPTRYSNDLALEDAGLDAFIARYSKFRSEVAAGSLGKTAQLWIAYMDHIWLVLDLAQAVKTNNFPLYTHSLHKMADLFF